jgi:hypothetical protein
MRCLRVAVLYHRSEVGVAQDRRQRDGVANCLTEVGRECVAELAENEFASDLSEHLVVGIVQFRQGRPGPLALNDQPCARSLDTLGQNCFHSGPPGASPGPLAMSPCRYRRAQLEVLAPLRAAYPGPE